MFLNWMGKPSWYLPACMIVWGAISCLTGITHKYVLFRQPIHFELLTFPVSFVGALLTRFFLGFVEAAFFPGALVSFSSQN